MVGAGELDIERTHPDVFRVRGPVRAGLRDEFSWKRDAVQTLIGGSILSLDDIRFLEAYGSARPFPIRSELLERWLEGHFVREGNRLLPIGDVYFGPPRNPGERGMR